jgi:hypothetical protein
VVQSRSPSHEVVDLAAYRQSKMVPQGQLIDRPQLDAEETITEIARYVMLIVQAIRRPRQ